MNKPISAGVRSRLAVTYRAISDLIPDPRNARTHPKRQIDQLKASIAAFGFTHPILADPEGNIIADAGFLQRVIGNGARVDAAFLDPPYNVRIGGNAVDIGRRPVASGTEHREFVMASGEMSEVEFRSFLADTLGAAARVSRDGAVHFVCMDWRHMDDVSAVGSAIYGERLNLCIWNKSNAGMGSLYRSKHELVFVYRVGTAPHLNMVELGKHGRNRTNVWDYASVNSMRGSRREDLALHPTVKPTGLVADAIQDVTRRGDLVLDLFLGSGTTLMATERTGRRFRGLDIDPAYVDVAIERWSARTGLEPRLEEPVS